MHGKQHLFSLPFFASRCFVNVVLVFCLLDLLPIIEWNHIGESIWHNESGKKIEGLTCWNEGEEFPSFGIGHFIWYPKGVELAFYETFPELILFLQSKGEEIPPLLKEPRPPWKTRKEFLREFHSQEMVKLRHFFQKTAPLQTEFILLRFEKMLVQLLSNVPNEQRELLKKRIHHLLCEPLGSYRLVDYVNFKGIGTSPLERYKGKGWGLLQVLEEMQGEGALHFMEAAKTILKRRIENAPIERNEKRWLEGWLTRVESYRPTS